MNSLYSLELTVLVKVYSLELIVLIREHLKLWNNLYRQYLLTSEFDSVGSAFTYPDTGKKQALGS